MTKISFVIVTRNRKKLLQECLASLLRIAEILKNEIIVVDNGSHVDIRKFLKSYKKKYRNIILIHNDINIGVAAARNMGVNKATGKFIIFLDDDTYRERGNFQRIIDFMEKNKEVGIVGPKILHPDGRIQESARSFPTPLSVLWRGTILHRLFPGVSFYVSYILKDFDHKHIKEVDWVLGACQVIRREVFETVGLLDEKYFFGYEDIDFCYRAKKAGWKVVYYPYSTVYHHYARESAKGVINRLKVEHIKSIIRFFYKRILHRYS